MIKPIFQDKPLYPEIFWQRPSNIHQKRGKVFILGGEKNIAQTLFFCEILYYSGVAKIGLGYPDAISKTLQSILPKEFHQPLPSSKEKTLSKDCINIIKKISEEYDLFVIGIGLSKNKETREIVKNMATFKKPTLFYGEGIIAEEQALYQNRHSSIIFFNHNLALWVNQTTYDVENNPFICIEKLLNNLPVNDLVVVYDNSSNRQIIVGFPNKIVVTKGAVTHEVLLGLISTFWAQNIHQPFESACSASFVAKIWQENFKEINEIEKAINQTEGFIEGLNE